MSLHTKIRRLFSTEDNLAILISFFILFCIGGVHFSQKADIEKKINTIEMEGSAQGLSKDEIAQKVKGVKSMNFPAGAMLKSLVSTPQKWELNPVDSIYDSTTKSSKSKNGFGLILSMLALMVALGLLFGFGDKLMGGSFRKFFKAFMGLFIISILAFVLGKQINSAYLGINYAIWAIVIGLIISNTIGTPNWLKPAVRSEYYIKTGLILLGAEILVSKILAIGLPGIFVSWVVTPVVLVSTYIFGQKVLKLKSKSLNMTICADMSVCGVSAAIATASATKAKKEELTVAITMSMIFTIIMMVVEPMIIKAVGMPQVLAGAWIGGTLDSTGSVVAAGKFVGDTALDVAATIKMIQNVLIGVVAFFVAIYWNLKVEKNPNGEKPKIREIWTRFPKFLIGFIMASIIFSIIYSSLDSSSASAIIDNGIIKGFTKTIKSWLFCLAFISIGLSCNFKELSKYMQGGKHVVLYVCGQSLNIILTLLMAYLMFYVVFPEVTAAI